LSRITINDALCERASLCSRMPIRVSDVLELLGAFAGSRISGKFSATVVNAYLNPRFQRGDGGPLAPRSTEVGCGLPYGNSGKDCRRRRAAAMADLIVTLHDLAHLR